MTRALALCCALSACDDELGGSGLGWTVEFACDSDRMASDQLRLIMHKGGCQGAAVYDQLLTRGEQAPKTSALEPGEYGFEAIALRQGEELARGCVAARLPEGKAPSVVLASSSCDPTVSAVDAGVSDTAVVLPLPSVDAAIVDPGSDAAIEPMGCTGPSCNVCERSCPTGQVCQNGACKPTDNGAASCVPRRYAGHDYLFCTDKQSWAAARRKCRGWGSGLAIIDDQAENDFIHSFAGGQDRWLAANDLGENDISGYDLTFDLRNIPVIGEESNCTKTPGSLGEGTWYWASAVANVSNDRSLCAFPDEAATSCLAGGETYQNWRAGEPDNATCTCLGVCVPGQDCALMHGNDGTWGDEACLGFAAYVCESP